MEKKINYYLESLKEIEALNGKRPTLSRELHRPGPISLIGKKTTV